MEHSSGRGEEKLPLDPPSIEVSGPSVSEEERRKSYTLSEVAKHTCPEEGGVWNTMDGRVYDVTEWMDEVSLLTISGVGISNGQSTYMYNMITYQAPRWLLRPH